jgi:hypothetical protein
VKALSPTVVWRDIDSISPYPQNAKKHPGAQIEKIASSIREFGFDQPIVLDASGVIIKGHGRYSAAKKLGMPQVPVIVRNDLTPAQVRQARIMDNKSSESDWDIDALALEFSWLDEAGESTTLTGFSDVEFHEIMNACVPGSLEEIDNAAAEKPAMPDETADWPKIHLKVPPETHHVFLDLLARCPGQKPHEKFDALLGAVDVLALEELARIEQGQ